MSAFFPSFETRKVQVSGATISTVIGGSGPPMLLLHGWPQSLLEWRYVAPLLAKDFTVVATDLRGYGESSAPPDGVGHESYCKRATARDQVEVMHALGFATFSVVGHDRGGRVAHRMALDFPKQVKRLTVIDIVPTLHVYSTVNKALATAYFHWFFLIQPAPLPETLLANQGEFFLRSIFRSLGDQAIPADAFAEYVRCFNSPATLHAMCEDYRAAASIDLEHDRADLDKKINCPLQVLWGERGAMHALYNVLETWRDRGTNVTGHALPGGHWLPEELPDAVYTSLSAFHR